MAFITKTEAGTLRQSFIASLPDRIDAIVRQAAAGGAASVLVSYAPASVAQANNFRTTVLIPAGWTVTQDDVAFTFLIS